MIRMTSQAFNEWMRRYTEEPDRFEADFRTCGEFLRQEAAGQEPSYGETAAAYLASLMDETVAIGRTRGEDDEPGQLIYRAPQA